MFIEGLTRQHQNNVTKLYVQQSERSSSVHNFEMRDNLPFINNAATQSIPLFSKKIKHNLLRISDKKCQNVKQSLIGFAKMDFLEIISHRRRNFAFDEKFILSKAIVCLSRV
jgi:hypothetical protein